MTTCPSALCRRRRRLPPPAESRQPVSPGTGRIPIRVTLHVWTSVVMGHRHSRRTSYPESSLEPPILGIRGGFSASRLSMPATSTPYARLLRRGILWAIDPTYAASGDVTIQSDAGTTSTDWTLGANVTFTFNNASAMVRPTLPVRLSLEHHSRRSDGLGWRDSLDHRRHVGSAGRRAEVTICTSARYTNGYY